MAVTAQSQGRLYKRLALLAAQAASDKKAESLTLLHTRPVSGVADYVLIASCTSAPHIEAVEDNIKKLLKDAGHLPGHRDGRLSSRWRVLDYGGLLVHLMHPEAREHYRLDSVFAGAKKVRWEDKDG